MNIKEIIGQLEIETDKRGIDKRGEAGKILGKHLGESLASRSRKPDKRG